MPALAPFLAHGRVLGAADRRHGHVAGDADVAADAFADVVRPSLLDLLRQERIGYRWPRRADEIEHAALHERHHAVGRGVAPDAHHRLGGELFYEADIGVLM